MIYTVFQILFLLLQVLSYIVIAQVILSLLFAFNVLNHSSDFLRQLMYGLDRLTAPFYRPIRRIMPATGGIDFSPMVLILAIMIVRYVLQGVMLELGPTIL